MSSKTWFKFFDKKFKSCFIAPNALKFYVFFSQNMVHFSKMPANMIEKYSKHDLIFLSKNLNHVYERIFSPTIYVLKPLKKTFVNSWK